MKTIKQFALLLIIAISCIFSTQAWRGRAVPMAYDSTNNQWSILLGHDTGSFWSDFSQDAQQGQRGDVVATQALNKQTNGVYSNSASNTPWQRTPAGDIIHFIPVQYKSGRDLYQSARNAVKDDFAWIPASEFLKPGDISRPHHRNQVNVSRGVKAMLQNYLPGIIQKLNAQKSDSASTTSATQPNIANLASGLQSWFGIPGAIYFYDKTQPYYEFTNFAENYPISLDGKIWPTVEQYYQAQKFLNPALQEKIRTLVSDVSGSAARKAFSEARAHSNQVRSDWRNVNLDFMLKALRAKFNQHPALKAKLLNTGTSVLVENAGANDDFFGAGVTGQGKNHLGKLLMHIRNELKTNITTLYNG